MAVYVPESFEPHEADILRRYFTNLDGPVFALVNLPEVVKGALFARYSRSPKSLRRLFLDEFVGDLDVSGDQTIDATIGLDRAEELYERVFFDYGDDSVAQLGGVHLACEQASNLLTKVLEWGRLMSYLEQSTRYITYDTRLGGRYRYFRDPDVLAGPLGTRYVGDLDRIFDTYSQCVELVTDHVRATVARNPDDSEFIYRMATRAKSLDAVRGILPAAATSNVGIYGTGQAFEALLLRMRAHPLPESREYADLMLHELRKVIPSFLRRVDLEDRGVRWSDYLAGTRVDTAALVHELFGETPVDPTPEVELVDFDPDAEDKTPGGDLLLALQPAGASAARPRPPARCRRTRRAASGLRRRTGEPSAQARSGIRAHVLPVRRVERLRRVPRHAAASHVDHRMAAAHTQPRLHATRADRGSGRRPSVRPGDAAVSSLVRRAEPRLSRAGAVRRVDGLPVALHDAVQRTRGDPHARAAVVAAGSSRRTAGSRWRCTG